MKTGWLLVIFSTLLLAGHATAWKQTPCQKARGKQAEKYVAWSKAQALCMAGSDEACVETRKLGREHDALAAEADQICKAK